MIIESNVTLKINQFNFDYYKQKGYDIYKYGQSVTVSIQDLPSTSGKSVHVRCEYCGNIFTQPYRRYCTTKGKHCCKQCVGQKILEVTVCKYGVTTTQSISEIRAKTVATCLQKFGYNNAMQNPTIRAKAQDTMIKKYGAPFSLESELLRTKITNTLNSHGKEIPTSTQQKLLADWLGGQLNFRVGHYYADMYIPDSNLCVEYDGGGHTLAVIMGRLTEQEFMEKQQARDSFFVEHGYKVLHLICKKDILPPKQIVIQQITNIIRNMVSSNIDVKYFDLNTIESN